MGFCVRICHCSKYLFKEKASFNSIPSKFHHHRILAQNSTFGDEMSALCFQDFGLGAASSPRCDLKLNLVAAGCAASAVESPTSKLQVIEDRPLSNKATMATQDITQIKPQRLHINLRPGGFAHPSVGVWVHRCWLWEGPPVTCCDDVICVFNLCIPPPR